ncbi:MAG: GTP-binding protein, partial [Deltaproteobacteria bacterium]|nr:GTP-binding protein [Deltaproteobacteria bacterium]
IVGRPNVGKSTLINTLTGQERIIASPIPGTTRDSIDMELLLGERKIVLVDTAGIRPRRKTADAVEKIMSIRSIDSIKKSNIAVLVIDAGSGVTHNDQQILRYILKENRGAVIAVNKTDILGEGSLPETLREVSDAFTFASFVPAVPVSALQGKGMRKLLRAVIG